MTFLYVCFDIGNPKEEINQKMGLSLSSVGKQVIACAPLFKVIIPIRILPEGLSQPIGKCYVFNDDMEALYSELPCDTGKLVFTY